MSGADSALAEWLRGLRDQLLLSQEELATRSGVSVGTIRGIEAGRIQRPRQTTLLALADALELTGKAREAPLSGRGRTGPAAAVAGPTVPRQLPSKVAGFTGRERELARLEKGLGAAGTTVISAIAGVGKSTLAVHAAHRVASRFPDGQLYVDLRGAASGVAPLTPLDVLGRFLRALGSDPATIPPDVDEAAAAFRSRTAGRKLLIVLDNARVSSQVRPLLPAAAGSAVVVTSRNRLSSLEGARHLQLSVLTRAEAIELLCHLVGRECVTAELDAATRVVASCGCLPLALRIAGARLASRPAWTLHTLAERLADQYRRLDELELDGMSIRASFAPSHQELVSSMDPLDQASAEAFGLLGLLDGPDIVVPVAARLLNRAEDDTERALERLVDAHLLENPAPGRYRIHDLLRLYARDLAAARIRCCASCRSRSTTSPRRRSGRRRCF